MFVYLFFNNYELVFMKPHMYVVLHAKNREKSLKNRFLQFTGAVIHFKNLAFDEKDHV